MMRTTSFFTSLAMACLLVSALSQAQDAASQLYLDGREHLVEERFDRALDTFRRVVAEHPDSSEADDAQYYVGYSLERLGRDQEAIDAYGEFLDIWPDSLRVDSARSHRAELLGKGRGGPPSPELLREVLADSSSWEVKRDTAVALARVGDLSAADVLEEIMRRESTSRRLELIGILASQALKLETRRILLTGLEASTSTSVKLRTLEAFESIAGETDVAAGIERLLASRASTSAKRKAIQVLVPHKARPRVREALARGLDTDNSTSVQRMACGALGESLLEPEVRPAVIRLFQGSASTSVQIAALEAVEGRKDDPAIAEVLREAVASRSSTTVKVKAIDIAGGSSAPQVRAVARQGLVSGNSSRVHLRAVKAFAEGTNEEAASEALAGMFRASDVSTSVQIAALDTLANHMNTPSGPRALALALHPDRSTSVQRKALSLAVQHTGDPEVKGAMLHLLEGRSTSTSVKLRVIELLEREISDPEVRRMIGSSTLLPTNSSSVQLKAVDALDAEVSDPEVRQALATTIDHEFSTSVVLRAIDALGDHVASDHGVKEAFTRGMQEERMSWTARIRLAEGLLPGADERLEELISESMEDVLMRLSRLGRGRGRHRDLNRRAHRHLFEDALDVLREVDPERAARLRER